MFHLLTAVTDASAFPMRRRTSPEVGADLAQPLAESPPVARSAADSRPLLSILAGPTHATSWYRPILCCGLLSITLLLGTGAVEDARAQSAAPLASRAEKIANALTAAPEEVTRDATVKDWPTKEGEAFALLRQGTNGWVCLPDDQTTRGNDPVCMDAAFHEALAAHFAGRVPKVTRVAYAYMLTSDAEGSNTDPTAQSPTATNQWHHAGPHVMVLFPNAKMLDGLPTTPSAYGPYVMFPGTPLAHAMLPVQSGYARAGSHNANANAVGKRP